MEDNSYKYTVYMHKFPNDKVYVGMTRQKIKDRWCNGHGYKHQPIYEEILKYGWDNIDHIIIEEGLSRKEAQTKESELIEHYKSLGLSYNISKGGDCGSDLCCEFVYNGKKYNSKELAELGCLGVSSHDICYRINGHNWDIEKAINQPKSPRNLLHEYNGKLYTSTELYEMRINLDLTKDTIKSRLSLGWDAERAITQPDNVKIQPNNIGERKYYYQGNYYTSYELWEMRKCPDIKQHQITNRINQRGWSVLDAISKPPKRYQKYFYKGQYYTSTELEELSPVGNLSQIIVSRIKLGWDVEKAVDTPVSTKRAC